MLLLLVYLLVCWLRRLALVRSSAAQPETVELLALRREVRVLRRQVKRTAWRPRDRLLLASLSRCLPRARWGRLPVRPETPLRWHRALVRRRWAAFGRRRGPGLHPPPRGRSAPRRLLEARSRHHRNSASGSQLPGAARPARPGAPPRASESRRTPTAAPRA